MVEPEELLEIDNGAVVAPAGHGKTEVIARVAALSRRALILTHTHAGVHAIKARLRRMGVPQDKAVVDTIAGWSTRYARAFPSVAEPPEGLPQTGAEWDQLYRGATLAIQVSAVQSVVRASYDRVLIDEYQDCGHLQHELAVGISALVPTLIFGDPLQGIFEFAGATLNWDSDIHPAFPLVGTLDTPHRWKGINPDLGEWIAETRLKLLAGNTIDLNDPRITYRECENQFDMDTLFDGFDEREGSVAAIHCNKKICYGLAKASSGGYQAIEEFAAGALREFSEKWDRAVDAEERRIVILAFIKGCFKTGKLAEDEVVAPELEAALASLRMLVPQLGEANGASVAVSIMSTIRKHPTYKLYRAELLRDAERALAELEAGRSATLSQAAEVIRQRTSMLGRNLPRRTVATPLLLKGLEFDHVVIPDATHFSRERLAQGKLFYVAISRATKSLTIASSSRELRFPVP